ncbi:MAG: DUF4838 domain-containing protein, partial [Lentisphaeria bacterium]
MTSHSFSLSRSSIWQLLFSLAFFVACCLTSAFAQDQQAGKNIELVKNAQPQAAIVIAANASGVAKYAAKELQWHLEKATGASLKILQEPDLAEEQFFHYIYLGATKAALQAGINADEMVPDSFLLRTLESDLYIVGKEKEISEDWWLLLNLKTPCRGTLYGVYEFLDRFLAVRWLWPGELGTYIPKYTDISLPPMDELVVHAFQFRAWFSSAPSHDELIFMQRHQFSRAQMPPVGHTFQNWWKEYGSAHPEWFMLNAEGKRGPNSGDTVAPMCVSNPDLQRFLVEEKWDGGPWLVLGEVDRVDSCRCDACRAWDIDAPETPQRGTVLADRYGRFWREVYDQAVKRNPDVKISTFFYWPTFQAPLGELQLNDHFFGMFVPWSGKNMWFPMPDDELEYVKNQWLGWKKTGTRMAYWSNCMHGGYTMPFISMRQIAAFLKFTYEQGSIGFFGDSLIGYYATKGPMYYLHMRLLKDPTLQTESILQEFYSAFGAAATDIKEYFDYWESYSEQLVKKLNWPQWGVTQALRAPQAYPVEAFQPAEAMLDRALFKVQHAPKAEFAERVRFISLGLRHAQLCLTFLNTLETGKVSLNNQEKFFAAQQAYRVLQDFRNQYKHLPFADLKHAENMEKGIKNLDALAQEFAAVRQDTPVATPTPWSTWLFQKDPDDQGLKEEWFNRTQAAANWQAIPLPAFWADTWVGDYQGYGWYRTTFKVPGAWKELPLNLEFGAVDEQAWVYVNGHAVGEHSVQSEKKTIGALWDRPFTIQVAAEYLRPGEDNVLV